jgi:hypothetical protein
MIGAWSIAGRSGYWAEMASAPFCRGLADFAAFYGLLFESRRCGTRQAYI